MDHNRKADKKIWWRRGLALAAAGLVAVSLGACRQEEQGRSLAYKKGEYQGKSDTQLSDAQLRELQHRGSQQKF